MVGPGRTAYLAESGGAFASHSRLRRCGWGIAFLGRPPGPWTGPGQQAGCPEEEPWHEGDFDDLPPSLAFGGGWFGACADWHGTALRAALAGTIFFMERTAGDCTLCPDCKPLIDGA